MTRTVYYAPGGGLGHSTRARRVLNNLQLGDALIVGTNRGASSEAAAPFRFVAIPDALQGDVRRHGAWIDSLLRSVEASRLIVDTFPFGIQGELAARELTVVRTDYVGRLLRWDEYVAAAGDGSMHFDTAYILEPLFEPHAQFVNSSTHAVRTLELRIEAKPTTEASTRYWLIAHSGPAGEVAELIEYAQELMRVELVDDIDVIVATTDPPQLPARFTLASSALRLYAGAARIISGCGFNTMLETEPWRDRHLLHPFPRRFDDQFERAARRRGRMKQQR